MELIFAAGDGRKVAKGPFQRFCLQGETLRPELNAPPIAVHEGHHWLVDGKQYTRIDCDGPIVIELSRVDGKRVSRHGPYKTFSAQDGVTFADHGMFAFADRSMGDWYCHADGLHWQLMLIEAVG